MINNWRDKNTWEVIPNKQGEHVYLFRLNLATPEELQNFFDEMTAAGIEGAQQNAASSYNAIRKGDLIFAVSGDSVLKLIDIWLPKYETFCDFIRLKQRWDEVLLFVNRQPRVGFRTKIDGVDPEEVERAKEFLKGFMVDAFEEVATFASETIERGDKVLMVSHPVSANNLRRVWAVEKEKNTLPKPFKPIPRGKFGKGKGKGKGKFGKGKGNKPRPPKKPQQVSETVEIDYTATPEMQSTPPSVPTQEPKEE